MPRYVVVDTVTKKILGGPYVWDGTSDWTPPMVGTPMLESAALSGGYTLAPAPVDPADVLRAKIPAAIAANNAFLAIASPTTPQVVQQVQRMTRQLNALGRLAAQLLDDTTDS